MSNVTFDNLNWLHLLWATLAVAAVGVYGIWRRQVGLRRVAAAALLPRLTSGVSWTRALVRLTLIVVSLTALVAASIGPRWGEQTQTLLRRNVDVMILLSDYKNYWKEQSKISQLASDVSLDYDVTVSCIFIKQIQWETSNDERPLIYNIHKEGVPA